MEKKKSMKDNNNFSKKDKVIAYIRSKRSINSSYYGNPRYNVTLQTKSGHTWYDCKTSSDGMLSYNNFKEGMIGEFTYHDTASGNTILNDFKTLPMFKKGDYVKVWDYYKNCKGWNKIVKVELSESDAQIGNTADYILENGTKVRERDIEAKRGKGGKVITKDEIGYNFSIIDDIFSGGILMF